MSAEHRITYIANIYDEKRVLVDTDGVEIWDVKKKSDSSKGKTKIQRVNPRHKLFCKCGGSVECKIENSVNVPVTIEQMEESKLPGSFKYYSVVNKLPPKESADTGIYGYTQSGTEFEPVICPDCKFVYNNFNQIEILTSHNGIGQNISRVKTIVFENEKTLALCCFANKLIVNHRSKKLFSKELKQFISYNKNKGFFVRGGQGTRHSFIRKFGLRFLPNNLREVIWTFSNIQSTRVDTGLADIEKTEIDMMSSMDEFCERLLFLINKSDAEKIGNILTDKLSVEISRLYVNLPDNILHPEHNKFFCVKHNFMFKYKLPAIMALVIYPPIATLFFTKGLDFTLGLLNSWIVPTTKILKKNFPTSPVKILEAIVKLKMIEDSSNRRSMDKGYKKASKLSTPTHPVYPKRFYKYDDKIPDDIKQGDKRVESIKITKNLFKNINEPELIDALLLASLNEESLPNNYNSLMEKYGLDACSELFRQATIQGRTRIGKEKFEHIIRLTRKQINASKKNDEYEYSVSHPNAGIRANTIPIDIYADTIRMMDLMQRDHYELMVTKDFDEVRAVHNRLVAEYASIKNEIWKHQFRSLWPCINIWIV